MLISRGKAKKIHATDIHITNMLDYEEKLMKFTQQTC